MYYVCNMSITSNERAKVFFDGKCGICVKARSFIQKLDAQRFIEFNNLWESQETDKINTEDLVREIHLITEQGKIYKGYFAIKYILLILPVFAPFRIILNLQLTDNMGSFFYRIISKNRSRLNVCSSNCTS